MSFINSRYEITHVCKLIGYFNYRCQIRKYYRLFLFEYQNISRISSIFVPFKHAVAYTKCITVVSKM